MTGRCQSHVRAGESVCTPAAASALGEASARIDAPAFSVLIAAYNGEAVLATALDSLIAQTRGDWEAIVVDDGSIDSTASIGAAYAAADSRIKFMSKVNGGTSSARNAGAKMASADLFALLDQDDFYLPDYFEKMGRFIEQHPDFEIYSCNAYNVSEDGQFIAREDPSSPVRSFTLDDMLEGCRIHPQAVFRREIFDLIGGFDEDRRCWTEDYDFWLRAMCVGARHVYDPEVLAAYRWSSSQKSSSAVACAKSDAYIFRNLVGSGLLKGRQLRRAKRRMILQSRASTGLVDPYRIELESHLLIGDLKAARRLYLRSRCAWPNRAKYALGLPVMMVSPRLFARLFVAERRETRRE